MKTTDIPYIIQSNRRMLSPTFLKYDNPNKFMWEPNIPFHATIRIMSAGKTIQVEDVDTGVVYWFLNTYLVELIHLDLIRNAQVTGTWKVFKHGQSYSIKLV